VRQIKLTHVGFRALVKIASRIVSYRSSCCRRGAERLYWVMHRSATAFPALTGVNVGRRRREVRRVVVVAIVVVVVVVVACCERDDD